MKEIQIFVKNIKDLRKQYGYTQKDVAEKLGIRYQSYQAYESGESTPDARKLLILADLYDVSLDFLFGRKDY